MPELTILMPCLNEAETLAVCIRKAKTFLTLNNIEGEILIADNGSTDGSQEIALKEGARVVTIKDKGYGNALIGGIREAKGDYIIMGDADDSYDFLHLEEFMTKLREGYDLVMGNRFAGGISKGAMPLLHRYLGNPVLSFLGRVFFNSSIGDFNCGLRGFNAEKIRSLDLVSPGMDFAPEMVVRSTMSKLRITEVPTMLSPDGRNRPPHLQTWHDGWQHLVFLLIYSPKWLFFIPSLALFVLSMAMLLLLLPGTIYIKKIGLDIHSLTLAGAMAVLSYQLFLLAIFVRHHSINLGLYPSANKHKLFYRLYSLERGILAGLILLGSGVGLFISLFTEWQELKFGRIVNVSETFRLLIPAVTLISLGVQTMFASFFIRILDIRSTKGD